MTDKELIKVLREDAPRIGWLGWGRPNDVGKKMADAADRLEALLAEVQIQICKRSELEREIGRLEAERDHFRDLTKKIWCKKRYGEDTNVPTKWVSANERLPESADHSVLVVVHGLYENTNGHRAILLQNAVEIATYFRDDEKWLIEAYPQWEIPYVTHWMPIPEPPSTKGVE